MPRSNLTSSLRQGDAFTTVERIEVPERLSMPEIPTPLTHTFTTHFDMRKGSKGGSSHVSTAMGMTRERRASMEALDETRPKFDHSFLPITSKDDSDQDELVVFHTGKTFHEDMWTSPWFLNACSGGFVILIGIFIAYRFTGQ